MAYVPGVQRHCPTGVNGKACPAYAREQPRRMEARTLYLKHLQSTEGGVRGVGSNKIHAAAAAAAVRTEQQANQA